jgi:predicted O-methyltransferase YrrM
VTGAARLRRLARVLGAVARQPTESLERTREKLAVRSDARRRWPEYVPAVDAQRQLHEALGDPWPCRERDEFEPVWSAVRADLAARGLAPGRGTFGGWDDGDPGFLRAAWCLTRHLRPEVIVESGVARGLTSAAMLRALERNGAGRLWSIDLPPLVEHELGSETGIAVGPRDRDRWTLINGSARRVLPGLLRGLPGVDLFVHDSMHTGRNVSFELNTIWPALRDGGAVLADDIERNAAFGEFARAHPEATAFVQRADDGKALFGMLLKGRRG